MPKMTSNHMSLGGLIDALRHEDPEHMVFFDFAALTPTKISSYRGYYEDVALGFEERGSVTVKQLLERLEKAKGMTFSGYKGGDYVASVNTPIWAANWGKTGGTAITGVRDNKWSTIIETEMVD